MELVPTNDSLITAPGRGMVAPRYVSFLLRLDSL
jgi:hypothetical protein